MDNAQARATLERWTDSDYYTVVDTLTDKIVIQTTSYAVAHYWRQRVNLCEHPFHYNIVEHDSIVEQWLELRSRGRESI